MFYARYIYANISFNQQAFTENCWMFNAEARKVHPHLVEKLEGFLNKYKIKMLGCWFILSERTMCEVYDAPSKRLSRLVE